MNPGRIYRLNDYPVKKRPVIYWMSRDQRVRDNWALLFARQTALELKQPLHVAFCLSPSFSGSAIRQYGFMLRGLEETEEELLNLNISFHILFGDPPENIVRLARDAGAGAVAADFSPLRISKSWKQKAGRHFKTSFFEVDSHNIVPCRLASDKQEYAAYTFRPKIKRLLGEYLEEFPELRKYPHGRASSGGTDREGLWKKLSADARVPEVGWIIPGEKEAARAMKKFLRKGLRGYMNSRNDPVADGQSNLSPYLHFGQLSPQRLALEVKKQGAGEDAEAFLEELIVRRELSDNFCFYNSSYDSAEGFPAWAAESHRLHEKDKREYLYDRARFERGDTHDELWNAAQLEMAKTGKMHGYMRMYWAKKILEWSGSPEDALKTAAYLNDRYELDGRDPNGYAGIMWAVGGVHDRAWPERPVFGKVRYMNYNGCKSKFNVRKYIEKARSL